MFVSTIIVVERGSHCLIRFSILNSFMTLAIYCDATFDTTHHSSNIRCHPFFSEIYPICVMILNCIEGVSRF